MIDGTIIFDGGIILLPWQEKREHHKGALCRHKSFLNSANLDPDSVTEYPVRQQI